ncbi:MAG TPA: VC0807 family protein [Rhodocyclaceae bacterium]|nr:VC0807 family protein [Rhodocyclaceae bacterium]
MNAKNIRFLLELFINLFLPWLAYKLAKPYWGELGGLLASAAPPMMWSLLELARFRRVDALSMLILSGILLSLIGLALGGDPKLLLVRESLISGLIGVFFLLSLLTPKPLIFYLAKATLVREHEDGHTIFEEWWQEPQSRRSIRTMTGVWGAGLTFEALLKSWLAWHWPTERYLAIGPVISYGLVAVLLLWTLWYRRRLTREET